MLAVPQATLEVRVGDESTRHGTHRELLPDGRSSALLLLSALPATTVVQEHGIEMAEEVAPLTLTSVAGEPRIKDMGGGTYTWAPTWTGRQPPVQTTPGATGMTGYPWPPPVHGPTGTLLMAQTGPAGATGAVGAQGDNSHHEAHHAHGLRGRSGKSAK